MESKSKTGASKDCVWTEVHEESLWIQTIVQNKECQYLANRLDILIESRKPFQPNYCISKQSKQTRREISMRVVIW